LAKYRQIGKLKNGKFEMKCFFGILDRQESKKKKERERKIEICLHFLSVSSQNYIRMIKFFYFRYDLHPDLAKSSYG
jgi:hypothetical protein